MTLSQKAEAAWPIWLQPNDTAIPIELAPGDGLLDTGMEVPHWRETFAGERLTQAFLHYVDRDWPFKEWKFDKRAGPAILPHVDTIVRKVLGVSDD